MRDPVRVLVDLPETQSLGLPLAAGEDDHGLVGEPARGGLQHLADGQVPNFGADGVQNQIGDAVQEPAKESDKKDPSYETKHLKIYHWMVSQEWNIYRVVEL